MTGFKVKRLIKATPSAIFAVLADPQGHLLIDSSGTLQSVHGTRLRKAGDSFTAHIDRASLGDRETEPCDVTVTITRFEQDALIEWTVAPLGQPPVQHLFGYQLEPAAAGTEVTSYHDWSHALDEVRRQGVFPLIPEATLQATLGILSRTVV
ncbi:SRPBCC family protein [Streptomyces sp. NPDC059819]|uniref:SRPBCC family protein n=1 Tax=Streptomyces sp. NPDC059819 TaxID=3346963 RepID=UPI003650DF96